MAFNRIQAARLLSAAEMELFKASLSDRLPQLDARQLRSAVQRTRTLRDKSQDLLRRQRLASQQRSGHKDGARGVDNLRTAHKVQALSEALQRFEDRVARVEAAQEREARRAAVAQQRPPAQPDAPRAAAPRQARGGRQQAQGDGGRDAARQATKLRSGGLDRIQAHVASQGRRSQARRDGRR